MAYKLWNSYHTPFDNWTKAIRASVRPHTMRRQLVTIKTGFLSMLNGFLGLVVDGLCPWVKND